eukprot:4920431-Alexandrium_andersonii.AAC.1
MATSRGETPQLLGLFSGFCAMKAGSPFHLQLLWLLGDRLHGAHLAVEVQGLRRHEGPRPQHGRRTPSPTAAAWT